MENIKLPNPIDPKEITKLKDLEKYLCQPLWPVILRHYIQQYFFHSLSEEQKTEEWKNQKKSLIAFLINLYSQGKIFISNTGTNDDKFREPINKIIVHHTHSGTDLVKQSNEIIISTINIIQLFNLYANYYSNPKFNEYYGKPVYSGHFDENGRSTFVSYHWLVSSNGDKVRILGDDLVGWHASGQNNSSIGIALVGDFDNKFPFDEQINALNSLITENYTNLPVYGHKDFVTNTTCPGKTFDTPNGWRNRVKNV
jgi:N-acetylmuramoyl-L-alanine amidase